MSLVWGRPRRQVTDGGSGDTSWARYCQLSEDSPPRRWIDKTRGVANSESVLYKSKGIDATGLWWFWESGRRRGRDGS